jgi:hypothetical protein
MIQIDYSGESEYSGRPVYIVAPEHIRSAVTMLRRAGIPLHYYLCDNAWYEVVLG